MVDASLVNHHPVGSHHGHVDLIMPDPIDLAGITCTLQTTSTNSPTLHSAEDHTRCISCSLCMMVMQVILDVERRLCQPQRRRLHKAWPVKEPALSDCHHPLRPIKLDRSLDGP